MCTIIRNRPGTTSPIFQPRRLFKLVRKESDTPAGVYYPLCHGILEYKWRRETFDPVTPSGYEPADGMRITRGFLHFCTSLYAARLLAANRRKPNRELRVIEVKPLDTVYGGVLDDMDDRHDRKMPQAICRSILVTRVHSASFPRRKVQSNGKRKRSSPRS